MTPSSSTSKRSGPLLIAVLAVVLLILHQDYWFWTNKTLVLGILPMGLFWHICVSVAAALTWYLATRIAWPLDDQPQAFATQSDDHDSTSKTAEGQH